MVRLFFWEIVNIIGEIILLRNQIEIKVLENHGDNYKSQLLELYQQFDLQLKKTGTSDAVKTDE